MSNATPPITSLPQSTTFQMNREKECKGSVRYKSVDLDKPLDTIYVSRKAFDRMPDSILVTIQVKA